jgi:hypothetical protein
MPLIDNSILQNHLAIVGHLRAQRNVRPTQSNPSVPPARFGRSSEIRTRPRHHFRRGAISEVSGQPSIPVVDGEQIRSRPGVRIRSRTVNEFAITIRVPSGGQLRRPGNIANRAPLNQGRELADRIRRGLVNVNTFSLRERINAAIPTLQNHTTTIRSHQAMDGNSRSRRDTHRYGRDGWWTVEHDEPPASQRPATIPGSDFAVPHSTLNLFQSVDLFAPPPRRPTYRDRAEAIVVRTDLYRRELENHFNQTVAVRLRGGHVCKGKIFTLSMELGRVRQLRDILMDEYAEMEQAEREAARSSMSRERNSRDTYGRSRDEFSREGQSPDTVEHLNFSDSELDDPEGWPNPDSVIDGDFLGDMVEEGVASITDIPEPEGWSNLDYVIGGDYPQEVCFRIGSREFTYAVEEVEDWIVDERRRERSARAAQTSPLHRLYLQRERERELRPDDPDNRRILHTLGMPRTSRSPWDHTPRPVTSSAYRGYDDETEPDDDYYQYDDPEDDIPDPEYDEEDRADETTEDLDHEGWGVSVSRESQAAERPHANSGQNARSLSANANVPVIDLTGSSSPSGSLARSRNTSDESDHVTAGSWEAPDEREPEAPHPVLGWTTEHSFFMFSCRGNIFDVTRQVQNAFAFQPELSPHAIGVKLNGAFASRHCNFIQTHLPGEEGIRIRASRRDLLYQNNSTNDDIYHGTQEIADGDVSGEYYALPPDPPNTPEFWGRRMDVWMLWDLNRGRFNLLDFWQRWRESLGGSSHLDEDLRDFLSIRLAQVRYLGITEAELATAYWEEMGSRGGDE